MQYSTLAKKVSGVLAAGALAVSGYNQEIINRAPEFQATQSYTIKQQGYVHENNEYIDNRPTIQYQGAIAQQSAMPLDVRESKCPTQGNCPVCHRLCKMPK